MIETATTERVRRWRWLGLVPLSVTAIALAATWCVRSVAAQLDRSLAHLGESAASVLEGRDVRSRSLVINGMRMLLHTEVVDEPLADALKRRADDCAPREGTSSTESVVLSSFSVLTGIFENDGYVACVDLGEGVSSLETFAKAAERFATTWDVAELGRLHYVYATRAEDAPAARTFLFSVSSQGPFELDRMIPRGGADASGFDPPDVPRFPKTQRILSAYEVNGPSGAFVYRVDASSDEVVDFFVLAFRRSGWRLRLGRDGAPIDVDGVRFVSAVKGTQEVTVLCPSTSSRSETLTVLWSGEQP